MGAALAAVGAVRGAGLVGLHYPSAQRVRLVVNVRALLGLAQVPVAVVEVVAVMVLPLPTVPAEAKALKRDPGRVRPHAL